MEKDLKSGEKAEIRLVADATGRFPIGFHASDSKSEDNHDHDDDDDGVDHKEMIVGNFIVEPN